ncbi:hypothetical protein J7E90_19495 [Streptomyces sp. ISL-111]|uniref:hypothetical protein n=1 Tax=Streptomyces sp. ISL-111 TaxID=2819175 RepID=UPI001BE98FF9|nr:hypothetical protein [Streptomyces sp. ISL-111]MBT2379465.1 hypothetical protein [Streptomyces sp. ISL-111]
MPEPVPGRSPWARLSWRTRVLLAAVGVAALLVPATVVAADLVAARAEGGAGAPVSSPSSAGRHHLLVRLGRALRAYLAG